MIILLVVGCLTITLFTVTPARADRFWTGLAIGVGSAILLNQLVNAPRDYYQDRPARVYSPPAYSYPPPPVYYAPPATVYYSPPPPVYRDRGGRAHWADRQRTYENHHQYRDHDQWRRRY